MMSAMIELGRTVGLIFLLTAGVHVQAENQAVNRLGNPGFECKSVPDGSYGNLPLYWTRAYSSGTFGVTDAVIKHGTQALLIYDTSASGAAALISDPVSVNPGYVYTARVWSRWTGSATGGLYLRFYNSSGTYISQTNTMVGSLGVWSSSEVTMNAPTNAATARIMLYSGSASTGTVYFDSASLVLADEEVWDGDFGGAAAGTLPTNWVVYSTHSGAIQDAQLDSGSMRLHLYDASSTAACGASYTVPASPGVPYKLSASVRKVAGGAGSAMIYLKFFNSAGGSTGETNIYTSSSAYTVLTLTKTAPADTAYAKVLCYLGGASTGTAYFDDISLTENYTRRYVAPTQQGSGAGTNAATATCYTNKSFWTGVNTLRANGPVKVTMLTGNYTSYWRLDYANNAINHLLVCGEDPYAVNYCDTSTNTYYMVISSCTNITYRHLNFTENNSDSYGGVVVLTGTSDVKMEGCTFTDMLMMSSSACSVWGPVSHNITWEYCSFVKIGWDYYDHCIYNTALAYNLNVGKCYFEDCNGPYVRYRSGSKGEVKNNTFISTGTQPTGNPYDRRHWPFVQICAFNNGSNDEILGDQFVISGNDFSFENTAERGYRAPYWIYAQGPAPINHPGYHLVPLDIGAIIENTNAAAGTRNDYIEQYFGINLMNDYEITGNTYSGCWPVQFMMTSQPDDQVTYWTNLPSETPADNCDLDKLLGLD